MADLWFKHYINPKNKLAMWNFYNMNGYEGMGIYWRLLELSAELPNSKIPLKDLSAIGVQVQLQSERLSTIISEAVKYGLLVEEDGYVFDPSIRQAMEEVEEKREWEAERKRKQRSKNVPGDKGGTSYSYSYSKSLSKSSDPEGGLGETNPQAPELPPPEPPDPAAVEAESLLETPSDQAWTRTAAFTNLQKRPLKKYPLVFLTAPQLAEIIRTYTRNGIPREEWRSIMLRCEGKVRENQKPPERCDVYSWLMSFLMHDALRTATDSQRLQNTKRRAA